MATHNQTNLQASAVTSLDPVWSRVREEAEAIVNREPELATFIYSTVLHHSRLEDERVQIAVKEALCLYPELAPPSIAALVGSAPQ